MSEKAPKTTIKLKPTQTDLLRFVRVHQQAIFSGLLSTIALEEKQDITDYTQFSLNEELTEMTLTEIEAPKKQAESPIKESQ